MSEKVNNKFADNADFEIDGNRYLAEMACRLSYKTILDVGFGRGAASRLFCDAGKKVSAIDRNISIRNAPVGRMRASGIEVVETDFEQFRSDALFDAIWMSHVLEHTLDVGCFLRKARALLSSRGWLFVMVPPFKHDIVGGHVTPGWNIGILMYALLVSGFEIKTGHFVKHRYNICGFVRKSNDPLPELCFDQGDIERTAHLWPLEVFQGFDGDLKSVNWFEENGIMS